MHVHVPTSLICFLVLVATTVAVAAVAASVLFVAIAVSCGFCR